LVKAGTKIGNTGALILQEIRWLATAELELGSVQVLGKQREQLLANLAYSVCMRRGHCEETNFPYTRLQTRCPENKRLITEAAMLVLKL
jgi:hypothetical protein